jgi:amino acid adenylation domain-containing protein
MRTPPDRGALSEKKKALLARLLAQDGLAQRDELPLSPRPDRARAPLSFAQQRLWFLEQLDPGKPTYNLQYAVRLHGPLDTGALAQALAAVIHRHDALRTSITDEHGEAIQQVRPALDLPLTVESLVGPDGAPPAGVLEQRIREEAERPFDLRHGPLIRVRLLVLGDHAHVLLLAMHHLVTDGWSLGVLFEELQPLYRGFLRGTPAALPALPIQFGDYAAWQRAWADGPGLAEQLAWWKQQLTGAPTRLELPSDRPRPAHPLVHGARYEGVLPAELAARLTALGQAEGATLYMVLLAGFEVLLHRYTGQTDLLVGTPIAQRTRVETERLLGCFASTLVLRGDLSGNPRFRALLHRTREHCLGAYAHPDVPFERLVEELQPERSLSHSPLFQVMFVFQHAASDLALDGLTVERLAADTGTTTFDLSLTMEPGARGLHAIFHYSTDLFDEATVARMAGHLRTLLEGIAARPDARLGELPLLPPAERHQLLAQWPQTHAALPGALALHRLFEEQASLAPDAVAVAIDGQRLSYAALDRRANQLAHHLRTLGVRAEARVGVCLERSLEMVIALLGILKAGAAFVPLDPSYPRDRIAFMADDAGLALVVCHAATADATGALATRSLAVDTQWPEISRQPSSPPAGEVAEATLAYVIYTSGSTGQPKGVMNHHRGVCNHLLWMRRHFRIAPDDASLQKTALGFDVAVLEIFLPLVAGARLVLARPGGHHDNAYLAGLIAAERITTLNFVPSALQHFLEEPELGRACASVRRVMCGGEAMPSGLPRRFAERCDARLFNLYGPTETSIDAACWECERQGERPGVPIGFPVANLQLFVLDRWLQPVPVGVPGELFIGGVGLARGYLARPGLTAERFLPHPFAAAAGERLYRTGDLARFLPGGAVEYLGRTDHQVKLRGFRIELGEIEAALAALPTVREAVVVVRPEPGGDGRLVAYLLAHPEPPAGSLEPAELGAQHPPPLPEDMIRAAVVVLEGFPRSPSGKVDRAALPPPPPPAGAVPAATALPAGALEETIAAAWRDVLGLAHVGRHDNFFDLGGHSLLLLRVHRRLRDELGPQGQPVMVMDLFRHPTISALAGYLGSLGRAPAPRPLAPPVRTAASHAGAKVAVVGMSLRLPGADTPAAFWGNLAGGHEAITVFSEDALRARGVDAATLADPHFVRASASLEDIASFDAGLFGATPREAALMDPQHRLFLECCWEALEHAGHAPAGFPGRIGIFAGSSVNNYLLFNVMPHGAALSRGDLLSAIASSNDQLATRAAYKLDLRGPSLSVQTACSTSLVAVHLACQSLRSGEADLVLAGGSSLDVMQHTGYLYTPGGILSPDGHCRPFGAEARGTVPGNGVATVVLRRLEDAVADGDTIYAVILASAINNDGAAKVGYTAPSIDGQAQVIGDALALAGIPADSIGLVEAHGTGTPLGDPIEVAALTQAFRASTDKAGFCALGSVKSNLGHLDAAAGVVGLIKAALALHHQQLPPSLHCLPPHPDIAFATSPFFLSDVLRPWPPAASPRRAAVSSFGIGGTNAHIILQEAPPPAAGAPSPRAEHLLLLSAHTAQALEQRCDAFSGWAHTHSEAPLADVAFTLQLGRTHLPHRRFLLASSLAQAADALDARHVRPIHVAVSSQRDAPVVFLFPGQGAQHPGMAAQLYAAEPVFRDLLDHCCALLAPRLGLDLRAVIFPPEGASQGDAAAKLAQTQLAQPALFVVEYCLARLWMHWGIRPAALLGHSIGQYTAACLAGVFSLEDALALVCLRGALLQPLPPGAMLAIPLPEAELLPLLDPSVNLAAVNTPALCVASGPHAPIAALAERLAARGIQSTPLHTSHAFHSHMVEPALPAFTQAVARLALKPPSIPILCNLSGQPLSDADATSATYWARHLRGTVRFSDALHGVRALADQPVLLEVGPGTSLASLARLHPATASLVALPSLPHPKHSFTQGTAPTHLVSLGQLWLHGVAVDWRAFHAAPRRRLPLPSLPFQRQRFWIDPPGASTPVLPAAAGAPDAAPPVLPRPPLSSHPRPPLATIYTPPRNDLEQHLVAAWEQLFGIFPIGIHDNFFELGGHSLLASQLCALLSARLSLQIPLSVLFDAPSPARLSEALEALLMETADV